MGVLYTIFEEVAYKIITVFLRRWPIGQVSEVGVVSYRITTVNFGRWPIG